jgi:hypothetical protein
VGKADAMELIIYLGCALGAGHIASEKGRSGIGYFILGLLLPIIGLLIAIGVPAKMQAPKIYRDEPVGEVIGGMLLRGIMAVGIILLVVILLALVLGPLGANL